MLQLDSAAEKKQHVSESLLLAEQVLGFTHAIHRSPSANGYCCPSLAPTQ